MKLLVFLGSVRDNRLGERVAKCLMRVAGKSPNYTMELIDAKTVNLSLVNTPLHWYPDQSKAPAILRELDEKVKAADGYIMVSAEYNRQVCPGLLNLLDHLPPPSFAYKPSGIVVYTMGTEGGAYAAVGLRPFLAEMGCLPVKRAAHIAQAHTRIAEDGTVLEGNERIEDSMKGVLTHVEWFAAACKAKRDKDGVPE